MWLSQAGFFSDYEMKLAKSKVELSEINEHFFVAVFLFQDVLFIYGAHVKQRKFMLTAWSLGESYFVIHAL